MGNFQRQWHLARAVAIAAQLRSDGKLTKLLPTTSTIRNNKTGTDHAGRILAVGNGDLVVLAIAGQPEAELVVARRVIGKRTTR